MPGRRLANISCRGASSSFALDPSRTNIVSLIELNKISVARSRHDSKTTEKSGDCSKERVSSSNLSKGGEALIADICEMPPCTRIRCIESGVGGSSVDTKLDKGESESSENCEAK
jgi:hypothetical protein